MLYMYKVSILIISIILLIVSCKDKSTTTKSCCTNTQNEFNIGNGKVYIADVFSQNADGINDLIIIFFDTNIVAVNSVELFNSSEKLILNITDFEITKDTAFFYLDDTTYYKRPILNCRQIVNKNISCIGCALKVSVESSNGISEEINKTVCIINDLFTPITYCNSECIYPNQFDGVGFNLALSSQEICK